MASEPPKVFISYSHDSAEHAQHVLELANRLRADGIDCTIDQYVVVPAEGWPRWMDKQIRDSDFVVMVCTETYYQRVMGEEQPGKGLGVRWEGHLIYGEIYRAGTTKRWKRDPHVHRRWASDSVYRGAGQPDNRCRRWFRTIAFPADRRSRPSKACNRRYKDPASTPQGTGKLDLQPLQVPLKSFRSFCCGFLLTSTPLRALAPPGWWLLLGEAKLQRAVAFDSDGCHC